MRCEAIIWLNILLISFTLLHTIHCAKPPDDGKNDAVADKAQEPKTVVADTKVNNNEGIVNDPPPKENVKIEKDTHDDTIPVVNEIINPPVHSPVDIEIPASIMSGFYVFVALGFLAVVYITYRSFRKFRIRSSRAARRYGTRGNHSRQELQPLPGAMESDSDGDNQQTVVFDRQP